MGGTLLPEEIHEKIRRSRELFPSSGRQVMAGRDGRRPQRARDRRAGDGIIEYGQRLVHSGGWIDFAGSRWQHDDLTPLAGYYVGCCVSDYWITEITLWWPEYPEGKMFMRLDSARCAKPKPGTAPAATPTDGGEG